MKKTFLYKTIGLILAISMLTGCQIAGADSVSVPTETSSQASFASTTLTPSSPFDGTTYISESNLTSVGQELAEAEDDGDIEDAIAGVDLVQNYDSELSVPTYITKQDDTWFIVDCYHNRVIYSDDLNAPLDEWYINQEMPHSLTQLLATAPST